MVYRYQASGVDRHSTVSLIDSRPHNGNPHVPQNATKYYFALYCSLHDQEFGVGCTFLAAKNISAKTRPISMDLKRVNPLPKTSLSEDFSHLQRPWLEKSEQDELQY